MTGSDAEAQQDVTPFEMTAVYRDSETDDGPRFSRFNSMMAEARQAAAHGPIGTAPPSAGGRWRLAGSVVSAPILWISMAAGAGVLTGVAVGTDFLATSADTPAVTTAAETVSTTQTAATIPSPAEDVPSDLSLDQASPTELPPGVLLTATIPAAAAEEEEPQIAALATHGELEISEPPVTAARNGAGGPFTVADAVAEQALDGPPPEPAITLASPEVQVAVMMAAHTAPVTPAPAGDAPRAGSLISPAAAAEPTAPGTGQAKEQPPTTRVVMAEIADAGPELNEEASVTSSGHVELAAIETTAAKAQMPTEPPASETVVDGGFRIQLAALRQKRNIDPVWRGFVNKLGPLAEGLDRYVVEKTGRKGRIHLVQAGPFASRDAAEALCDAFRKRKGDCIVVDR